MFGSAQRHSQYASDASQGFNSSQHSTPFRHPSASLIVSNQQQPSGGQPGHHPTPVYGCYSASVGSTNFASQFNADVSQPLVSAGQGQPSGQTKAGQLQGHQRSDNRAKSERFFRELQQLFSSQLDRIKDDISQDLRHFKDVDENIKRSMGLNIGNLSEDICSLKDDVKTAIRGYSKRVEECFKEQEAEVHSLCQKIKQTDRNLSTTKKKTAQSIEDSLAGTFQFLTHEIKDLQDQMSILRSQMKADTEFAIERIKDVKTQYVDEFSKHAERQHLINQRVIDYLQAEKKREADVKMRRYQTTKDKRQTTMDIEQKPTDPSNVRSEPIRRKRRESELLSKHLNTTARTSSQDENSDDQAEDPQSKKQPRNCSSKIDDQNTESTGQLKGRLNWYGQPVECFKEVSGKLDYLRKSALDLENEEKMRKKAIRGGSKKQKVGDPTNPREARAIMRRLILDSTDEIELHEDSMKGRGSRKVIVNQAQEKAKEKAREIYGPKIAALLIQASNMISTASKGVGMMRSRVAISSPN